MTTCKCVRSVTDSYLRWRNKDGGHANRLAVDKNPMLHFTALCVKMRSCWGWNFHTARIRIFAGTQVSVVRILDGCRPFSLLWPWPWPDNLRIRTWPVLPRATLDVQIWTFYVKAFQSYRYTERQNRLKLWTTLLHGWSINDHGHRE